MPTFGYTVDEIKPPKKSYTAGSGWTCTRTFKIPGNQETNFVNNMYLTAFGSLSGVVATRFDVMSVTDKVGTATFGDVATNIPENEFSEVTVTYTSVATKEEVQGDGSTLSYTAATADEFMIRQSRGFKWQSDDGDAPPDANSGLLVAITVHEYDWKNVAAPNWTTLNTLRGQVNSGIMTIPVIGSSAPAETVLYMGYDVGTDGGSTALGATAWNIKIKLMEKRIHEGASVYGWNHQWRDDPTAQWDKLVNKDNDEPAYKTGTISAIFTQM